jgi:O-antigen/teichoic acid export membrane protein
MAGREDTVGHEQPVPTPATEEFVDEVLGHEAIRARAVSGALLIAGRGVLLLLFALAANVVLARELSPKQIGLVSFGVAIMTFAAALSDGGLGAGLIRSTTAVDKSLLKAVLGLQLVVTVTLFVVIATVAVPFGLAGQLTAVMALSLPINAIYTPAGIMLERSLRYRTLAQIEVLQAVAYYAAAIVFVVVGLGVWGLAVATLIRSVAVVLLLLRVRPDLFFLPTFSLREVRPLLRFGLNYQATNLVTVVRDQGLNIGIAAIGGTATLGLWTLARRILELPMLLFQTLWRVSFPTMSRLTSLEVNLRPVIERGAALTSIGTGFVLATLAASAPALVPAVFGSQWQQSGELIPIACAGLIVAGPISVATAGYLYSAGEAGAVLRATIWHTLMWLLPALALLAVIGPWAIPLGWLIGSSVDAVLLARPAHARTGAQLFRAVSRPSVAAAVAGSAGLLATFAGGRTVASGLTGAAVCAVVYVVLIFLLNPQTVRELLAAARGAVRTTVDLRSAAG